MPIIREWRCGDCGTTGETMGSIEDVVCHVCEGQEAERVFLTAPGIKSPQTSGKDRDLQALASDYGLSNMSNRDGAPVKRAPDGPTAPTFATGTPQAMQMLGRVSGSGHADSFSPVLPALRAAGRPHQWRKTPERRG